MKKNSSISYPNMSGKHLNVDADFSSVQNTDPCCPDKSLHMNANFSSVQDMSRYSSSNSQNQNDTLDLSGELSCAKNDANRTPMKKSKPTGKFCHEDSDPSITSIEISDPAENSLFLENASERTHQEILSPAKDLPSLRSATNRTLCANVNPAKDLFHEVSRPNGKPSARSNLSDAMPCKKNTAKRAPKKKAKPATDFSKQADKELARWMKRFRAAELRIVREQERRYEAKLKRRRQIDKEFGDLCEATEGLAKYWRDRDMLTPQRLIDYADGDAYCIMLIIPLLRKLITRIINRFQTALTRPLRYKKENKIRRKLAAERRKITKRKTTNPCPTVFQIFEAWEDQKKSHVHYLRLGALLEDLECYVDNSLRFDENGFIVGREHGIKGWIQENLDFLTGKYSSMMRCKATAKRLRQIANIKDPISLLDMLPPGKDSRKGKTKKRPKKQRKMSETNTNSSMENAITVRSNFVKSNTEINEAIARENTIMVRSNSERIQAGKPYRHLTDKAISETKNTIMVRSNCNKASGTCSTPIAIGNEITVRSNSHYPNETNREKNKTNCEKVKTVISEILGGVADRRTCLKDYFDGIIEILETEHPAEASKMAMTTTASRLARARIRHG